MNTDQQPWIVGVGASGSQGLHDLRDFLAALSPSLNAVVLVVLHRTADKPSYLQSVLAERSRMPVGIAHDGEQVRAGVCYIGEPGEHLTLGAGALARLVPDSAYRNRTIDLLFKSIAAAAAPRIIGVVLSGSLDDGARGLKAIHEAGGLVMTRLPDHAAGQMPTNAIAIDGPMDFLGLPASIAREIEHRVRESDEQRQPFAS